MIMYDFNSRKIDPEKMAVLNQTPLILIDGIDRCRHIMFLFSRFCWTRLFC